MKQKEADAALFKKLAEVQNNVTKANRLRGPDFFGRVHSVTQTIDIQKKYQLWLYCKTALQSPSSTTKGHDIYGNIFEGPNFATQDYLGLASNPSTKEVAIQVVKEFGIHSGGAALAFGTHPYYLDFQREICEFWGVKSSLIFPTGWMAGYGVIRGLVRPWDHIVMDKLAHNCLQEGAKASTPNIHMTEHLNVQAMIDKVKEIRAKDKEAGILVVTESLFSMDSDTPDLDFLQKECKKQQAFLLIDMAHDLGALGKKGLGALETQNITDLSNVMLMGSGSKSLASNIGFIGCVDEILMEYIRYYSPPFMFSNVVAPPQCAVALHNLRIIRSEEGERLREKVMNNAIYLRKALQKMGYEVYGNPSPIVILITGDELVSRIVARLMLNSGVIVNGIEFPIVPKGKSRLRLQLQATHTQEHLDIFLSKFDDCYKQATEVVKNFMESVPKETPKL